MVPDLDMRIRERLAGYGCCEGYRNPDLDRVRAAVLAVLGCHPSMPVGILDGQLKAVCNVCNEPYPCREVRYIAVALGLEVSGA